MLGAVLGPGASVDGAAWQRIGRGLLEGDPLADAVAQWLHGPEGRGGMERIARAARDGVGALSAAERAGAGPVLALFERLEAPPAWVRPELVEVGARLIDRSHPAPYYVLRNMGLLAGYTWRDLNRPLVLSGALEHGASRRVAQTMKWTADVVSPAGLQRGGRGYCSTVHVRVLHAVVRRRLAARPDWDAADLGLPINQTDMAATWLAFSVVLLGGLRLLGVPVSEHEARGVMHLWKLACWQLGVDEHWLTDDEAQGRRLLYRILSTFRGPDDTSVALAQALTRETAEVPWPHARALRWRWETGKHLAVASLVLGPGGMQRLGLPTWVPPWYPAAVYGWNQVRGRAQDRRPDLRSRAEARGRAAREALVALHFAGQAPDLARVESGRG